MQAVSGGQAESYKREQLQPVSESCESSATQQLLPSESPVVSKNQDSELASADPTLTAEVTESAQLSEDHSITESSPDQTISESQDQSTGITESPQDQNITESSQDQPQVDDANATADSQVESEVRDDVTRGSDQFGSETASQEVENQVTLTPSEQDVEVKMGIATELTEKDPPVTGVQLNVDFSEKPQEPVVTELNEKDSLETTAQPNTELREKPQEVVSELNENAQEAATGLAEVQGTSEQEGMLAGERRMEEGGKEEEEDEVVVSYSPVRDEDDQPGGGDGVLDDHATAGQDVESDEEPRSKLAGPAVCDVPAAGTSGGALTTEDHGQEVAAASLIPVKSMPTPEEGETSGLATGTGDGDHAGLEHTAGDNAATPDVVPKVASDGVPIPPLPPLPPGVPAPPPPPPPPPGVEVEEKWPYPRPLPSDVPNDDSIPTPPLPPGVPLPPPPPSPPPLPSPARMGNQQPRPTPSPNDRLPASVSDWYYYNDSFCYIRFGNHSSIAHTHRPFNTHIHTYIHTHSHTHTHTHTHSHTLTHTNAPAGGCSPSCNAGHSGGCLPPSSAPSP